MDIEYIGSYQGTDEIKITATLTDDWKFADNITADMLSFPEGFNVSVDVARESDTKLIFTVTDIPENYSGVVLEAVLNENAIDSEFATDSYLSLDFFQPSLKVEPSSVSFDEATDTYTIGKVSLPEGVKGVQNGISVSSALYTITEQSYNETENYYSFKLTIDGDFGEGVDTVHILPYITVDAVLKTETEEIKYTFNPYNAIAGISGEVTTDIENGKVYIEITPYNATFAEGFSASNIAVTGSIGLDNFAVSSVSSDKIVYVADYTAALTNGVAISFSMNGTALNTNFRLENYSIMLYVPPHSEGRDIDWGKLGGKLAKSAASGLGSAIGESVAGFVLPYVYDFLDIDTSDPELNAIRDSITQLTHAIGDLSKDISRVEGYIEIGTNKSILDGFQSLESDLLTTELSLLSNEDVVDYVIQLVNVVEFADSIVSFDKFTKYIALEYGSVEHALEVWGETDSENYIIDFYNECCDYANKLNKNDFERWMLCNGDYDAIDMYFGHSSIPTEASYSLDISYIYDMLQGARQYDAANAKGTVDPEIVKKFLDAVKEYNGNNAYLKDVNNYGEKILKNASGTSGGIIDLYFQVIDSIYNFESQTIAAKRAFVSKVQSIYLVNAAIALQYCDDTNDANAASIRSNIPLIMEKIDAAFKQIDEMEARAAKGNDRLLVSGQVVSKEMVVCDLSSAKYQYKTYRYRSDCENRAKTNCMSVSLDSISTMINRSLKRGLSLAEDLTGAGFTNITSGWDNESTLYFYLSGTLAGTVVRTDDHLGEFIAGAFGAIVGIDYEELVARFVANFVGQNGKGTSTFYRNNCVMEWFQIADAYSEFEYKTTRTCKCLMGFGFAK